MRSTPTSPTTAGRSPSWTPPGSGGRRRSRKRSNSTATMRTERAIERADVCVLVVDAERGTAQPGLAHRDTRLGRWVRTGDRRQQVGPDRGEGRQHRQAWGGGTDEEGAVPRVRAVRLHLRDVTGSASARSSTWSIEVAAEREVRVTDPGSTRCCASWWTATRHPRPRARPSSSSTLRRSTRAADLRHREQSAGGHP
jgi:hypothetical protein